MFHKLENYIKKSKGTDTCTEMEEFQMLIACYNIWQVVFVAR